MRTANEGYVEVNTGVIPQKCVPTGHTRVENGIVYAEMIPIEKGYYKDKFWVTREQVIHTHH